MSGTIENLAGPKQFGATEGNLDRVVDALNNVTEGGSIKITGGSQVTFATAINYKVTVGNGSTPILAANPSRKYAAIVNDSDTVIYISLGSTAVLGQGIRLNAGGGSYEINAVNLYTGAISGISSSTNKNVSIIEA